MHQRPELQALGLPEHRTDHQRQVRLECPVQAVQLQRERLAYRTDRRLQALVLQELLVQQVRPAQAQQPGRRRRTDLPLAPRAWLAEQDRHRTDWLYQPEESKDQAS